MATGNDVFSKESCEQERSIIKGLLGDYLCGFGEWSDDDETEWAFNNELGMCFVRLDDGDAMVLLYLYAGHKKPLHQPHRINLANPKSFETVQKFVDDFLKHIWELEEYTAGWK